MNYDSQMQVLAFKAPEGEVMKLHWKPDYPQYMFVDQWDWIRRAIEETSWIVTHNAMWIHNGDIAYESGEDDDVSYFTYVMTGGEEMGDLNEDKIKFYKEREGLVWPPQISRKSKSLLV
jgi:hypothetical protein